MSPALMTKYLEAARVVIDHMMLTPRGLAFASHPVVTDTDRDKYCVKQIVQFYQRQPTDLADYFFAAWIHRYGEPLGRTNASLQEIAIEQRISPKYLETIWTALVQPEPLGPLAALHSMWESMPDPSTSEADPSEVAQRHSKQMRDYVLKSRQLFVPKIRNLTVKGGSNGSQPLVLWKNKQYAIHRRLADFAFLDSDDSLILVDEMFEIPDERDLQAFKNSCKRFCSVFPDAFYVSERGRDYLDKPKSNKGEEKGRLLSAGFHSMTGYYRDDQPLYDLLLDESQQRELDALWQQLMFVSATPMRQYQGFLWFEKAESKFMRETQFDFVRSENKESWTPPMIARLAEVYLKKAIEAEADDVTQQGHSGFLHRDQSTDSMGGGNKNCLANGAP